MTNKEIIMIDEVDISECKGYYFSPTGYHSCQDILQVNDLGYEQDTLCEQNPNCYFKQLKRKEQECEELKRRLQCNCFDPKSNNNRCISYNRIAKDYERDLKRLENKTAECEELKKELDKEHLLMLEKQDKATRYFLVINEIKEYIYNNTDFDVNDSIQSKTSGYDILQIIKGV